MLKSNKNAWPKQERLKKQLMKDFNMNITWTECNKKDLKIKNMNEQQNQMQYSLNAISYDEIHGMEARIKKTKF